jgi:hypothetical protein
MDTVSGSDHSVAVGAPAHESAQSAVSWAAIFSGAFAALATTFVLLSLAAGLGLWSISPWPNSGASVTTFTITMAVSLIVIQWLASALGGYLSGRLRTKWVGVHTHEVFFRDTAHGFLSWALATVAGSLLLGSVATSVIGGGLHAAGAIGSEVAQGAGQLGVHAASSVSAYDVDSLFRSGRPDTATGPHATNEEAMHILASGIESGNVPAGDRAYLAQLVSGRTGISTEDAQKRVDDVVARAEAIKEKAMQTADAARRATSRFAIFAALSMLVGAFIASVAAAYGGGLRDEY